MRGAEETRGEASGDPLWQAIEAFRIGPENAALSFHDRLARENGWSGHFTGRVVEEYKRFVYLAMRAGHPVTPSDAVDQAWHLHLLYTESYWTDLCGGVLQRPLHHGPTRGGAAEGRKFRSWYRETCASYARVFGGPPPADVWPSAARRFRDLDRFRRVDTARWLLVPRLRGTAPWVSLAAVATFGCASLSIGGRSLGDWLSILALASLFLWLVRFVMRNGGGRGGGSGCGACGGCGGCGGG